MSPNIQGVNKNIHEFEKRIKTTLQNYESMIKEYDNKKPEIHPITNNIQQQEGKNFVKKLLEEHRNNKNIARMNSLRQNHDENTKRFENESIFNKAETNRNSFIKEHNPECSSPSFSTSEPLKEKNSLENCEIPIKKETNYVSFSDNHQKSFEKDEKPQNLQNIKQNLFRNFSERPSHNKENIQPMKALTNIYSGVIPQKAQLKIEDLMKETSNNSNNNSMNKSLKKTSIFDNMKVEDRLTLRDIGRSAKIYQMVSEKQMKENAEFSEIPKISEQSKAIASNSMRVQHNPDIIKRLLEDHKISKVNR